MTFHTVSGGTGHKIAQWNRPQHLQHAGRHRAYGRLIVDNQNRTASLPIGSRVDCRLEWFFRPVTAGEEDLEGGPSTHFTVNLDGSAVRANDSQDGCQQIFISKHPEILLSGTMADTAIHGRPDQLATVLATLG